MLAEFWVDLLLYLAPSAMMEDHTLRLFEGGELITLLWTFFADCGVYSRMAEEEQVPENDEHDITEGEQEPAKQEQGNNS